MRYWKISNWMFSFGSCEYVQGKTKEDAAKQWSYYTNFNSDIWGEFKVVFTGTDKFKLVPNKATVIPPMISTANIEEVTEAEYVENVLL